MKLSRLSRLVVAVSVMALAPVGGVASAQTTTTPPVTCAIAQGPLTTQQESVVNDYEVQVAKANAKHTPVPAMPDEVYLLIGCISPASQTGGQTPPSGSTTSAPAAPETTTPTTGVTQPTTTSSSSSSSSSSTFKCPANGLSKDQLSQINDFEILVARANSKHTQVPQPSPEVANYLTCQ
jgi:hypothetical protein